MHRDHAGPHPVAEPKPDAVPDVTLTYGD